MPTTFEARTGAKIVVKMFFLVVKDFGRLGSKYSL